MTVNKRETLIAIKPSYSRYTSVDNNIFTALTIHAYSLYIAFRHEAEFNADNSEIKRSAQYLYTRAKIKKSQYYLSMKELEDNGLVLRDPDNKLGDKCVFHVARELGYFNRGVHDMDRGVHDMDTDHKSFSLSSNINITTSDVSDETSTSKLNSKDKVIEDIKAIYHEELPELPKIRKLDRQYKNQLNKMIKDWPSYQIEGKPFTLDSFRNYLRVIKDNYGWFLKPYTTESGNIVKCSLRKLTREINITKIVNGEFSAK